MTPTPEHQAGYLSVSECERWNAEIIKNFWQDPDMAYCREAGLRMELGFMRALIHSDSQERMQENKEAAV